MSRIDEALQRASESPSEGRVTVAFAPRAGAVDSSMLEGFPKETAEFPRGDARREGRPLGARATVSSSSDDADGERLVGWNRLVADDGVSGVSVEQYRRLAATLHDLQVDRGLRTLMVTSSVPQEGKTLTVANLALTLSGSYGRRVLVVDADLRRPSLHDVLRVPCSPGLSDVLGCDGPELPVRRVSTNLHVLPAGGPDGSPTAGLTSDRMRWLLDEAAREFDWVLLDAPPVGFLPDAQLLAHLTRAVVFVIQAGATPLRVIQRAIGEIGRECIIGAVMNGVDERSVPDRDYYGHYYHRART